MPISSLLLLTLSWGGYSLALIANDAVETVFGPDTYDKSNYALITISFAIDAAALIFFFMIQAFNFLCPRRSFFPTHNRAERTPLVENPKPTKGIVALAYTSFISHILSICSAGAMIGIDFVMLTNFLFIFNTDNHGENSYDCNDWTECGGSNNFPNPIDDDAVPSIIAANAMTLVSSIASFISTKIALRSIEAEFKHSLLPKQISINNCEQCCTTYSSASFWLFSFVSSVAALAYQGAYLFFGDGVSYDPGHLDPWPVMAVIVLPVIASLCAVFTFCASQPIFSKFCDPDSSHDDKSINSLPRKVDKHNAGNETAPEAPPGLTF